MNAMKPLKSYVGTRLQEGCEVYVESEEKRYPLPLRLEIRSHSPTGFEWGYGGSGPAQLALAILADHFGPLQPPSLCPFCNSPLKGEACIDSDCGYQFAEDKWMHIQGTGVNGIHYQDFKRVIAARKGEHFRLTTEEIEQWIEQQRQATRELYERTANNQEGQ